MAYLDDVISSSDALCGLGRYLTIGLMGTILDVALFIALDTLLGMPALTANTLSYSAGMVNNYIFHRRWTFANRPRRPFPGQFAQFAAVNLSALAMTNLLILLLVPLFPRSESGELLAKVAATIVGMCWNFLANHLWTFRDTRVRVATAHPSIARR